MELNFRSVGQGYPMVILHGLFGSCDNWLSLAQKMNGFQVFLPDLRNHGQSPWSENFTIEDLAEDLAEFVRKQNLKDPILVGHSLGGKTVMKLALQNPDAARAVCIVDKAPRAYEPQYDGFVPAMLALDLEKISSRQEAFAELTKAIPDTPTLQFLLKSLTSEAGMWKWRFNLEVLNDHYDEIWQPLKTNRTFARPALFLRGEKSDYVQDRDIFLIKELFPNAHVQTIENAGHWLHAEKPSQVLGALYRWLKDDVFEDPGLPEWEPSRV